MAREYNYDIMREMKTRYALKHFQQERIPREELLPLFEAARYAPSCFNEQPERYILGDNPEDHEKLASCLNAGNAYAKKAPVLILVLTTRSFTLTGQKNPFSRFDAGTATGFLQLEAVRRGFGVHCMAGFDSKRARELFDVPEDLDIIAMIALGRPAPLDTLTEEERAQEVPGTRNALETFLLNG
ncbi:nitroreductase family protein [Eubacteriales bacterium OttesenSCG-928-A19]|nr:nitroreductase family protein [Eubacteriales bacterium OttesenSCG-928-A19]